MISDADDWQSEWLERLRETYEGQGLQFISRPSLEVVPDFLGNYRPDAIAFSPQGGVVIRITTSKQRLLEQRLSDISKAVARQNGWEFKVVYVDDPDDNTLNLIKSNKAEIQEKIDEIRALIQSEHYGAALVICWAVLEALARTLESNENSKSRKPYSPMQTVQQLAMDGYLDTDVARRLREMVKLRNSVVHGDLKVEVDRSDVEFLATQIGHVASTLP